MSELDRLLKVDADAGLASTMVEDDYEVLVQSAAAELAALRAELESETNWANNYSQKVEKLTHDLAVARAVLERYAAKKNCNFINIDPGWAVDYLASHPEVQP